MLEKVKTALNITGNYQDSTIQQYIDEVVEFLKDSGVNEEHLSPGIVTRGVSDLWNYGAGEGKLSQYFLQRATQLRYKGEET